MTAHEARKGADEANIMRFEDVIDIIRLAKDAGQYYVLIETYEKEFCERLISLGYKIDHNSVNTLVSWM